MNWFFLSHTKKIFVISYRIGKESTTKVNQEPSQINLRSSAMTGKYPTTGIGPVIKNGS